MKKCFLSIVAFCFAAIGANAAIGDDLTSKYLQNADFSAEDIVKAGICTYDYDMETNSTTLYGQQAVTGWTALNLTTNTLVGKDRTDGTNARAAGVFAIGKTYLSELTGNTEDENVTLFLGGGAYTAPDTNSAGEATGNALGMVAVWGAKLQYTQEVTLPAGAYTIEIPVYNIGGTGSASANFFGFIAEDGTQYLASDLTWEAQTWMTMTVTFLLTEETKGVISLGYTGPGGSATMPHLFVDYVKITEADPQPIIQAQIDALKVTLLELLNNGDELGVSTTAGWAVYNNASATADDVQQAIDNQKALNEKGMTDFTDFFINNAHFALGSPLDNGVATYDYDMAKNNTVYYGMQPVQDWTASNPSTNTVESVNNGRASGVFAVGSESSIWLGSVGDLVPATKADGSTEGNVFGFISVWTASSSYTQNVTLPAGSYTITIPTYNERGTTAIAKNLCGFIASDGTEYLAESTTFPVGSWSNETIKFTLDEETSGVISIGYTAANKGSNDMPHLFIDEFTLMYNGLTDIKPSLLALQGAVRTAEGYDYDSKGVYEKTLDDKLQDAISDGKALVSASSSDDDANSAAATAINSLVSEIKASINVYAKFKSFIDDKVVPAAEKYSTNEEMSDFADELADLRDTYDAAYENGAYTTEEINTEINGFNDKIVNATKAALAAAAEDEGEHNIDITCLFNNLDYANSTIDGWQNETGTTAFLSRVQTAEVWNQSSFNVYQTLTDLPAGAYEISAPGFYRTADNASNYTQYTEGSVAGTAYIYAGGNKTLMHNVAEYAINEQDDYHETAAVEGEIFVPNSNASANHIFYTDNEAVNTVTTALAEAGDLNVGVKASDLSSNAWVVWGAFTVTYKGTSGMNEALYAQITDLVNEAQTLQDAASSVIEADQKLNDAVNSTEDLTAASSIDDLKAGIQTLQEAIAYGNESVSLVSEMEYKYSLYNEYLMGEVESSEETFPALLDAIGTSQSDGYESNEQIEGYLNSLATGFTTYVQYPVLSTASEENPGDITKVILNPGFEGVIGTNTGAEYWEVSRTGGNAPGYDAGIYEFYNNDNFDIHQTIKGLAAGYYRVRVQSFYRAGDNAGNAANYAANPDTAKNVVLYANEYSTPVKNQVQRELEDGTTDGASVNGGDGEVAIAYGSYEEFYIPNNRTATAAYNAMGIYWNSVDCYVDETGELTIGLKKDVHVDMDWCPFDNFELYYLGTEAPTGVKSISTDAAATGKVMSTIIYSIDGTRQAKLSKGVNIIKATMSDGSVRVQKVLVR